MKQTILLAVVICLGLVKGRAQLISVTKSSFPLEEARILVDENDHALVKKSAELLQQDVEMVTGKKIAIINTLDKSYQNIILIGSIGRSALIKELIEKKKLTAAFVTNKWEAFQIKNITNPFSHVNNILTIVGSDRRGTAYGVLELSKQMGVSPWYWWADVPVVKKTSLYIKTTAFLADAPKVKYRGIFINDEAPCLSRWAGATFGGFNHKFYSKVFELILRLKGNYIWPAMWGNAFYDDDSINIKTADDYGIVIGTSHHEPLMRAHDEWRRYGKGKWNYDSNEVKLKEFWKAGMQRATNEKIVSVGMRGDGDEPMSRETATTLLERIVKDQRTIIEEVTDKPAANTPQLWALYKEVQDYYDKGMRVPDDVTLLLCDDNWGNIRKLPHPGEKPRKGGYGIYYHFDYVGGPRNYKWINTNPIPRVWEQMHMAWEYNAREIWIVNVGDIKPMEFPISFFLDYAWNPDKIGAADLKKYTEQWAAAQFGEKYARDIADIITKYGKYNGRRKPELLDATTYEIYTEWDKVTGEYNDLLSKADKINNLLPAQYRDAYFQLVLHPVKASANLYNLYNAVAWNRVLAKERSAEANAYADKVKQFYNTDSLITLQYHQLGNGKWNYMMSQTHIGYTNWQQPPFNKMPEVRYVPADSAIGSIDNAMMIPKEATYPKNQKTNIFYERSGYVSIGSAHYTKALNNNGITWKILPDHGRTGDAITTFPVTAPAQHPGSNAPQLQYEIHTYSSGDCKISAYFSPTLNFHNTEEGLQYAISVDDEVPQIISINAEDKNTGRGIWNKWVSENIIIKTTKHNIAKPGKHIVRYRMVNSGVVLQQLVVEFGVQPGYLGPPETKNK
ncbi:MAG: glycosyl hydrolase 115 family protein [Chitinophagaceae bacterium]